MEAILTWITTKLGLELGGLALSWGVGGILTVLVAWLLKRIPNDVLKAKFGAMGYGLGSFISSFVCNIKWAKMVWQKVVEPWIIDTFLNVFTYFFYMLGEGLKADNDFDVKIEKKIKKPNK